jgi:hypothetical protein
MSIGGVMTFSGPRYEVRGTVLGIARQARP